MAPIIIASIPVHGHVAPLLEVARLLVDRGDRVRFLTGARFADAVQATGATHVALPEAADFDDRIDLGERFPARAGLEGIRKLAFDLEHIFVGPTRSQHDAVMALHAAEPADVVLADPAFAGAAYIVGHPRSRRPAVVVCGVLPLSMASPDVAPFGMGLPPARVFNRARNRLLTLISRPVFRRVDRLADEVNGDLHRKPLGHPILDWAPRADAIVQFTVAAFEYPRSDAPSSLRFVGPLRAGGKRFPPPAWWSELDGLDRTRPVIHVTQGTIANKDYRQLIAPTLEALAGDDVRVVVATGGRPIDTLPPLPGNARAAEYFDYDELMPRTAVLVTNGGYGGVHYALRHGVPIVAIGATEDKPEVGARIAWSGVGRSIRTDRPTPNALRRAIHEVIHTSRYRENARRIAADMAAAPGFAGLVDVIDSIGGVEPHVSPDRARAGRPWSLAK